MDGEDKQGADGYGESDSRGHSSLSLPLSQVCRVTHQPSLETVRRLRDCDPRQKVRVGGGGQSGRLFVRHTCVMGRESSTMLLVPAS